MVGRHGRPVLFKPHVFGRQHEGQTCVCSETVFIALFVVDITGMFARPVPLEHKAKAALLAALGAKGWIINPRYTQNYKGEGFVGRLAVVYRSCAKGPFHSTAQKIVLTKYIVGLQMLLGKMESSG